MNKIFNEDHLDKEQKEIYNNIVNSKQNIFDPY